MVNCCRYALLTSVLLLASGSAEAAILYSYDLDSLVYLSTDIVEGTLVGPDERRTRNPDLVEISAVYKRDLSPGSRIPIRGIPFYQMPAGGELPGELVLLESGMRVILFLQPVDREFDRSAPRDALKLVWSGVKVLRDGRVLGFLQHFSNPGPYVLETPLTFKSRYFPPIEEFRKQLADSVDAMDILQERLKSDAVPEDVPWLMKVLETRRADRAPATARVPFFRRDHVAELVCSRLASLHIPEALDEALQLDLWYDCRWILGRGFGTPAGREFLIRRIEDANLPLETRLRYAGILDDAGADYFSGPPNRTSRSHQTQSSANANYLTRLARVAFSEREHEQLSLELLKALDSFARSSVQQRKPAVHQDLMQAAEVLSTLHGKTASTELKYQAELVIAHIERELHERLGSACGPILSVVLPYDGGLDVRGEARTLACSFKIVSLDGGGWSDASVVIQQEETGDEYLLTFDLRSDRHAKIGGMRRLNLPADLPRGRYRVFLRFWRGDQVVSNGYPFETDL